MTLPHAGHNVRVNPLQLPSVVAPTMVAFQTNKMVRDVPHLTTILAVNVARHGRVRRGHGLHSHGRIQQCKVLAHVIRALLAQGTGIVVTPHVHREATEMHDVPTPKTTEGFRALKHGLVANGTVSLKSLRNAVMIIFKGDTGVASHAVAVIDAQTFSCSANIAERAVVNILSRRVVVKIANLARVPGERLSPQQAIGVHARLARGLQRTALHAQNLRNLVSVQRRVLVLGGHFTVLFAAEAAGVEPSRIRVTKFA